MNRFLNHALAAVVAVLLSLGSIGAIVTVPPAQAEAPTALALPEIA
jgi:hypothetical protein